MITIGFNYSQLHDSSACIARDGEVLFAVAEERLSRVKHDEQFPHRAIQACLDFANVRPDEVDEIVSGWPHPRVNFLHDLKCYALGRQPISYLSLLNSTRQFVTLWHQGGGRNRFRYHFSETHARFRFIPHHLAHAISAWAFSGFPEATVLITDGHGGWEATSVWHGRNGRLESIDTIPFPNSLGLFYGEFTDFLGFQRNSDEWKVMGLAPYGEPGIDLRAFCDADTVPYRVAGRKLLEGISQNGAAKAAKLGVKRIPESEIDDRHKNVAFAVQDVCEIAMMRVVEWAIKKTGCRNLCLAGGVALNSKANGKILASGMVDQVFIQPAAGDDGVCLGAALAPCLDRGGKLPVRRMRHAYLGPQSSDEEIGRAVQTYKLRATRVSDPAVAAAQMLSNGKILGWFQGRMEFGPRALGSRSILADPRDPEMNTKVNNAVKFREWWRPFAPSMLAESAHEYIESATDSPFMILTAQVRPEKRSVIPSVTHVDGSARPQTVERDVNPLYWKLIHEFGQRTGVPVVMNTSFNLRGEPIVCTPTDAIRTFFSSGLDALVIGSYVVEK